MSEKRELIKEYFQLARKLGKLPSSREVRKFICSSDKFVRIFGSFKVLQEQTVLAYPSLNEFIMPAVLSDKHIEDYRLSLEKTKRVKDNKATLKQSSTQSFIEHFSTSVFSGKIVPHTTPKTSKKISRSLILTLSDLHFGSDTKAEETGAHSFGRLEEARRFAEVIKQTIEYKPQYRQDTELHVNLLGDIIQHKLHDAQDAAPISEQVCRAIHLLSQGIAQLGQSFGKVTVHCATGNHGRDMNRHPGRATSGKWDSVETVIYYAVKSALTKFPNVLINIPKTPYVLYDILGHKVMATHGDNVINPVGHVHVASITKLGCGANLITNGPLCPVDQFAVSIGILEGQSSQTLVECTAAYPLGDIRFLEVGEKQDKDQSLDKIIKPWTSF
jgi:hypothetical protein